MPYPDSPFATEFNEDLIIPSIFAIANKEEILFRLKQWLCKTPNFTTIRMNPLLTNTQSLIDNIESSFREIYQARNMQIPKVHLHKSLNYVILVDHLDKQYLDLNPVGKEVVVDHICGAAVLRGAHVFAPGVVGMTKDCRIGDKVSLFADTNHVNRLKRGFARVWESPGKVFIANGIVRLSRDELFADGIHAEGIAIEITDTISGCPALNQSILHDHHAILQQLPSIVCVEVLDPLENEHILDMCASPGGKTSHIAVKLNQTGILIALDRSPAKVARLIETCDRVHSSPNLFCFCADSTNIVGENSKIEHFINGPPFEIATFDRILLDAPCSATGNRPQLLNKDSNATLKSFVPLQRKLFENAYKLLKINGIIVYSTCSITIAENEGIVQWALRNFDIELIPAEPRFGSVGFPIPGIENPQFLQRFDSYDETDSIGFFIAKFKKVS